jgi:hypothetical protein
LRCGYSGAPRGGSEDDERLGALRAGDERAFATPVSTHQATSRARTRAERRNVSMSALVADETATLDPAVEPARFHGDGDRWAGHWLEAPLPFPDPG